MAKMTFTEWTCEVADINTGDHDWPFYVCNYVDKHWDELIKAYRVYCGQSII